MNRSHEALERSFLSCSFSTADNTAKSKDKLDKVRIAALIRDDIPFKIREDLMSSEVQTIWIEILREKSIYRGPSRVLTGISDC